MPFSAFLWPKSGPANGAERAAKNTNMHSLRHVDDILLWNGTNVAWPSFTSAAHICFQNNNTLNSNSTYIGTFAGIGNVLWFDNVRNNDFCIIDFEGKVASITSSAAPAADSIMRAALVGLPIVGPDLQTDPFFATHPLENTTYPLGMADAWFASSLGGQSQTVSSQPPYFGMFVSCTYSVSLIPNGWPFNGNAIAANDRWAIQFPIGKLRDGSLISISGYRKFGISLKSINPTLVAGSPSAFAITGKIYAHIYEYRRRR